jgi:hypothetical protein
VRSTAQIALIALASMPVVTIPLGHANTPLCAGAGQPPAWNLEPGRGGIEPGKLDEWAAKRRRAAQGKRGKRR